MVKIQFARYFKQLQKIQFKPPHLQNILENLTTKHNSTTNLQLSKDNFTPNNPATDKQKTKFFVTSAQNQIEIPKN